MVPAGTRRIPEEQMKWEEGRRRKRDDFLKEQGEVWPGDGPAASSSSSSAVSGQGDGKGSGKGGGGGDSESKEVNATIGLRPMREILSVRVGGYLRRL
uniref:Uncharacterized protein n=1 Tax=Chromera velia CCMP2878 TaxID=1169474 RepID=A0A0G4G7N1_9ALVE|eukprot:Cvel_4300.t1-p1 / transcript=Cvel_4300.t1 / gene=Cvel_4300 / organism=Chromera_velia_CCMP2878 / gene_product=hypothetical protein / transcript_product=hypothetical protein / location=Cvel_scaffold186:100946-106472(-) / protein_length=97 / sequence_SO=supercontig / SO=protein_coding / is_pseudo=false